MLSSKKKSAFILGVSLTALMSSAGYTQDIDYGSLQDLFGEAVTTSATGKPQRVNDAPVTMDIITAEQIRRSGSNDLGGIIRRLAGVDSVQFSVQQTEVGVRGYNQGLSPRLLVLLNGRQVYINLFGFVAWGHIPVQLEEIRQIEVVKGPNTALFGFNAASAVVNIVTYNPAYDSKGAASASAGTNGYVEGRGFVSGKLSDEFAARASIGYKEVDTFKKYASDPTVLNNTRKHHAVKGALELMFMPNDGTKIAAEFTGSDGTYDSLSPSWAYNPWDPDTTSFRLYGSHNTDFGQIKGQVYQNRINLSGGLLTAIFEDKLTVAQLETLVNVSSKSTVRLAGEYRKSSGFNSEIIITPNAGSNIDFENLAISGLWDYAATDKLSIDISARYDHQDVTRTGFLPTTVPYTNEDFSALSYSEFTYNLGAVYKASATDTFRAIISRGVLTPNLVDLAFAVQEPLLGNIAMAPSPEIKPTTIQHFELGYDHKINSINGILRMAAYYQKSTNVKTVWDTVFGAIPGGTGPIVATRNVGDSDVYGFEVGVEGKLNENIKWGANYSYSNVQDDFTNRSAGGLLINPAQHEEFDPNHHANAWISYTRDQFEFDVQAHYVGDRSAPDSNKAPGVPYTESVIPDNLIVDARMAYHLTDHIEFEVKGTNVTMKKQYQYLQPVERRVYGGIRYTF